MEQGVKAHSKLRQGMMRLEWGAGLLAQSMEYRQGTKTVGIRFSGQ